MRQQAILLTAIFLLAVTVSACSDFLNNDPEIFVAEGNFYETEDQMVRATNGLYSALQPVYNGAVDEGFGNYFALAEMRADNTTYQFDAGNRGNQQLEEIDEFLMSADNNWMNSTWNELFNVVSQANAILGSMEDVPFSSEDVRLQIEGEARFVRALTYFHLIRLFGGLPFFTEAVDTPEDSFTESRTSADEIYDILIEELERVNTQLPASYSGGQVGKATRGAALTLLGEIYLTRQNYESARRVLTEVTNLGYTLVNEYSEVFSPLNKNNAESIFEIQYSGSENGEEQISIFTFAPIAAPNASLLFPFPNSGGGLGFNIPTKDLIASYEEGDERFEGSVAFYTDSESGTYSVAIGDSVPFIKKLYHPSTYPGPGRATENWPVYRYAHVLLMLAEIHNELGETSLSVEYLNQVRTRAGLDPVNGGSQSELRDIIYHELRVELAFENHRWYNLLRTGRAQEVMRAHGQQLIQSTPRITNAAYNILEYKLLYPIPQREVRLNEFMQNPEW